MKTEDLDKLTEEINYYKSSYRHLELMQRMDEYERNTSDSIVRAVLLVAKASSALCISNLVAAEEALLKIDVSSLTPEMRIYIDLTKASAAHEGGRLAEADRLLSSILASKEIQDEEQHDAMYQALAQKGFLLAAQNQFGAALEFLEMASTMSRAEDWSERIEISKGFCLQGLGRLNDAEKCLRHALSTGPGILKAEAYYRLAAVELQRQEFTEAKADFRNALDSLPCCGIRREDILSALREAERRSTRLKQTYT